MAYLLGRCDGAQPSVLMGEPKCQAELKALRGQLGPPTGLPERETEARSRPASSQDAPGPDVPLLPAVSPRPRDRTTPGRGLRPTVDSPCPSPQGTIYLSEPVQDIN